MQACNGLPETGMTDMATWRKLLGEEAMQQYQACLRCSSLLLGWSSCQQHVALLLLQSGLALPSLGTSRPSWHPSLANVQNGLSSWVADQIVTLSAHAGALLASAG